MELLDRYLQAVAKHLPWRRQDDILAELRANLEAQLEDKEAALGRALTADEAQAWLKQLGSPLQMAARYRPVQYLIGPAVFPIYWYVLRLALGWALVIYIIVNAVLIATRTPNGDAVAGALAQMPGILLTVAGWVTLVFAGIEIVATRWPEKCPPFAAQVLNWSPETLPPLEALAEGKKPRRSRAHAIAEVVFGFLVLIWMLLLPAHPYLLIGPAAYYLPALPCTLAQVCWQFYWWNLGLNALQLAWHAIDLARGRWQQPQPVQHIVFKTIGLIPLWLVITVPEHALVLLRNPAADMARYGAQVATINYGLHRAFQVLLVIVVLQFVWDLWQMGLDAYRRRMAGAR